MENKNISMPAGHPGQMHGGGLAPSKKNELRLVFWELTARCNLKCIHCRAEAQTERQEDELSTEKCFAVIDELCGFSSPILILTGGEPLYRDDIFDIARYAAGKGLRVALATNGTLVNEKVAEQIKESGIKRVSISLDGANPQTHDTFRMIPGSFKSAFNGIRNLQKEGIEVQINTTIARHNEDEVKEILDLALNNNIKALHIFMLVPVGCGIQIADSQMLDKQKYEDVLSWFYDKTMELRGRIELKATCAPHFFRIMHKRAKDEGITISPQTHGMAAVTKGCLAGSGVMFISRKGVVQPCGYLPVQAGNITKESVSEIWNGSEVFLNLRDTGLLKGKCGICEYKKVCEGCRARAYYEKGDYMEEEPYCIYEPTKGRLVNPKIVDRNP
ncbi:MAG: radical SAM protein [Candidatus Acidulodesulfobacterium ferriphilum]|uniref:Radical SAM protein n=1 Tax=Candidatus Acidulodesulfobacterium ferriphilum TaxID=2597223 RepID=A0A519BDT5_9DELT|nr:MAG: radical SAM protein [Candidatus Acidulodesulfobacterium ferriphilum]